MCTYTYGSIAGAGCLAGRIVWDGWLGWMAWLAARLRAPSMEPCWCMYSRAATQDYLWARSMLERADRREHGAWRMQLDFVAVCYSIMHRRQMLRSVRAKIRSGGFKKDVAKLLKVSSVDFSAVAEIIGEQGGLREALLSDQVDSAVKDLLRSMQLAQLNIPGTDGHCTKMRHQLRSLQVRAEFPLFSSR